MAPKFALFTKGSKLPLNKGLKSMFELLQSCAQPSIYGYKCGNIAAINYLVGAHGIALPKQLSQRTTKPTIRPV